jgi:glycine betaine/proline transport system substrate-binding protein
MQQFVEIALEDGVMMGLFLMCVKLEERMMKRFWAIAIGLLMCCSASAALAADCGKVTIGEMNWGSAQVIANVEKFVLEAGYGCQVQLIQTSTVPAMTSMVEKGEPDIASEIWVNSVKEVFNKGMEDGRVVSAGNVLSDGGVEAWWIPEYFAKDNPKIKTVEDVIANAQMFQDPEDPSKGRFYNCPSGWACKIINNNLFRAYNMEKKFNNFDPGSAEGLAGSIAKAYERKEPWFGYYWAPTSVLGKYPMVKVELGNYSAEGHTCNTKENCDKPQAGRYPPSEVLAATTKKFADSHKAEFEFLQKISIPNDVMNAVLAWGEDNQAEGDEMAGYFIKNHGDLWTSWLPDEVESKVKAALP